METVQYTKPDTYQQTNVRVQYNKHSATDERTKGV